MAGEKQTEFREVYAMTLGTKKCITNVSKLYLKLACDHELYIL